MYCKDLAAKKSRVRCVIYQVQVAEEQVGVNEAMISFLQQAVVQQTLHIEQLGDR